VQWLGRFSGMKLNDHQRLALVYMRRHGRIANRDYQRLNFVDGPSATKDLRSLVDQGLTHQHSTRGGAHYGLATHLQQHDLPIPRLSHEEAEVAEYLASHEYVTNGVMRELLQVDYNRARYLLGRMVRTGVLRSDGKGKGTKYYLRVAMGPNKSCA
jgi:predicted HTH transcriptional regulator